MTLRYCSRCVIALSALLFLPRPALAWGPEGHEIVAHIAAQALTPRARAQVSSLLGGDAETMMTLDASWADEVRDARPQTAPWHYVNIELDEPGYDARRDCPHDDCVVAQIERDEAILASHAPPAVRAEALKFLIHFVGDLHQPLHVADDHDRGGNARLMQYRGQRVSLHHVWDDAVVSALGRDPAQVADALLTSLPPAQRQVYSGGAPKDWADQSFQAARGIYAELRGDRLPGDYAQRERAVTATQLAKAGLRLAAALNAILR